MIPIRKQAEPLGLKNAKRKDKDLDYDSDDNGFSKKKEYTEAFLELRNSLLEEQGYICCYCQQKIKAVKNKNGIALMKTEHFIPKGGKNPDLSLQLEYTNLLAACRGNSDKKGDNHCDTSKSSKRLKVLPNPAKIRQSNFNQYLKYKERGRLGYVDVIAPNNENEDLKADITLLNLNEQNLGIKRYATWKGIWNVVYKKGKLNVQRLIDILSQHDYSVSVEPPKRDFKEFCGFITQWFENRFKDELEKARK